MLEGLALYLQQSSRRRSNNDGERRNGVCQKTKGNRNETNRFPYDTYGSIGNRAEGGNDKSMGNWASRDAALCHSSINAIRRDDPARTRQPQTCREGISRRSFILGLLGYTPLALAALSFFAPEVIAATGTELDQIADTGVTTAAGIGYPICAAGVVGAGLGGLARSGGGAAAGVGAVLLGGAIAKAPNIVETILGQAAGISLHDLQNLPGLF